ncbi:hypothetical protein MNBD_ALPHA11-1937 [hydrothermal vent metagenome]|uniref:Uncharacterized protein n=1 Tax=hydrothermal vent metagenome TaxID=652676 RepID=A0A3B0U090_9ZZZZ
MGTGEKPPETAWFSRFFNAFTNKIGGALSGSKYSMHLMQIAVQLGDRHDFTAIYLI